MRFINVPHDGSHKVFHFEDETTILFLYDQCHCSSEGCALYCVKIQIMKTGKLISAFVAGGFLLLGGCASTGLTVSSHLTDVQLTGANYRIIATNISGEGTADAVLGVSLGVGFGTSQVAMIPLKKSRRLYHAAMQNLWDSFEAKHGPVANRRLALVNLRYDSDALNLLVYTKVNTVVTADVVEFE